MAEKNKAALLWEEAMTKEINFTPTWEPSKESLRLHASWRERDIKISEDKRMIDGDHYCDMMKRMDYDWPLYLWMISRPMGRHSKFIPSLLW